MSKMHIKTGDTVMILSGKDRGKKGKILEVSPKEGKVIICLLYTSPALSSAGTSRDLRNPTVPARFTVTQDPRAPAPAPPVYLREQRAQDDSAASV